jgi:hypothetical protein
MNELQETQPKPEAGLPLGAAPCSATFAEWCKTRGVWPRLTHEEIWHTAWNAAIKAADDKAWSKRDLWDEGDGYSPTKVKAAEEIGYAIRTLMSPNGKLRHGGENPNV